MTAPQKLFGTDGIRGRFGEFPLDEETVFATGLALARHVEGSRCPKVLIGMDTRESGPRIASLLAGGVDAGGAEWDFAGILPTPAVAHATHHGDFALGVMVSASHNPFEDNGIKVFGPFGYKLPEESESELEGRIGALRGEFPIRTAPLPETSSDAVARYVRHLLQSSRPPALVRDLRIVVDCAHGAASEVAPTALERLGVDAKYICRTPNGRNINAECGALHTDRLAREVVGSGAALGAALDGDADRCLFVDENGDLLNGDNVLLLAASSLVREGRLRPNLVVATVMSNLGLEIALREMGTELRRTPVGDKYVIQEMLRTGTMLGGEQSGHTIFGEHSTTGDGLLTLLMLLRILATEGERCSALRRRLRVFPQQLINVPVREKRPLEELPEIRRAVSDRELELGERGRILIRYSGTEPLARIMVEAEDTREVLRHSTAIADLFGRHLGQ